MLYPKLLGYFIDIFIISYGCSSIHNMKNILVIRIGRAGDMVMLTPALLAILDNYPEYQIHILTSVDGKRVLNGFHERLTKFYVFESGGLRSHIKRIRQKKQIRKCGYEYIFNYELKSSYKKIYQGLSATVFEIDKREDNLNYAKRCLNVVQRAVTKKIQNYWDWLPVTKEGVNKAKQQLMTAGINDDDYVVGIHPSFSGLKKGPLSDKSQNYLREWPPENFAEVIRLLASYSKENNLNLKLIMDLLPDEIELGNQIVKQSGNNVKLFTPKPEFERYKALIQRMDLLITPNTGPMHIAAAVGTKNICLFSGKSPEDCGPYMQEENYVALRSENYGDTNLGLRAIKPEHVFEACKRYLPSKDK